jgi:hypothetical protein
LMWKPGVHSFITSHLSAMMWLAILFRWLALRSFSLFSVSNRKLPCPDTGPLPCPHRGL